MPIGLIVVLVVVAILFVGWMLRAWRMMKNAERLLKDVDPTKIKDLDNDGWDE